MLARRKFLAMLGLAAGGAAAVKVNELIPAAAPPPIRYVGSFRNIPTYEVDEIRSFQIAYGTMKTPPLAYVGQLEAQREINLRRSISLRFAEANQSLAAIEREEASFDEFMAGEQWTPEQINRG